ncbi:translocation/assembly module TamB domain-containing protein [Porticoccaceae bacterium LTM1]|nr:translocation/assembly module TamB domain-containing protein [Porticoccaceae bacterium LTM1]
MTEVIRAGLVKKALTILAWVLAGLLVIVVAAIFWLLGTEAGARTGLDLAQKAQPQLKVGNTSGTLWRGLNIDTLQWQDSQISLDARQLQMRWDFSNLLDRDITIELFQIGSVTVTLAETDEQSEPSTIIAVPEVKLPWTISINRFALNDIKIIRQQPLVQNAKLTGDNWHFSGSQLRFESLQYVLEGLTGEVNGELNLTENYPLDIQVQSSLPSDLPPVSVTLNGDLSTLKWQIESWGKFELATQGQVNVLDPLLPLTATLKTQQPFDYPFQSTDFYFAAVGASISGNLDGLDVDLESRFTHSQWPGEHVVSAKALVSRQQAELYELVLQLPDGLLKADGLVDYDNDLSANLAVTVQNLRPSLFIPHLTGTVSGQLTVLYQGNENSSLEKTPKATVHISDLDGTLQGKPVKGKGSIVWVPSALTVDELKLTHGNALIEANGQMPSKLNWQVQLPNVSAYLPEVEGAVSAKGYISGNLQNPTLQVSVNTKGVRWGEYQLSDGQLGLLRHSGKKLPDSVSLNLKSLTLGSGLVLNTVALDTNGNSLKLALNADPDLFYKLGCKFNLSDDQQKLALDCEEMQLSFPDTTEGLQATWGLSSPLTANINFADSTGKLSAWTLSNVDNPVEKLGIQEPISWSADNLSAVSLSGERLPLEWVNYALAQRVDVRGHWSLNLEMAPWDFQAQPTFHAGLLSEQSQWLWSVNPQRKMTFDLQNLTANVALENGKLSSDWKLISKQLGAMRGELTRTESLLSGKIISEGIQLQPVQWFVPQLKTLEGEVNTDIQFSLENNKELMIYGGASMQTSSLEITDSPVRVQTVSLTTNFSGRQATVNGEVGTDSGGLNLTGTADWRDVEQWQSKINIKANQLTVEPAFNNRVTLSTDLTLNIKPEQIALSGEVNVPHARLSIRKIPTTAIGVSDDTVIVGQQQQVESPLNITTDLKVALGKDVQFQGVGLFSKLNGSLRIRQRGEQPIRADGVVSLSDARYKAYGQDLSVKEGKMIFAGSLSNPDVLVRAVRTYTEDDVEVGVLVQGPVKHPELSLFSNPAMSESNRLSYLLTGRASDSEDGASGNALTQAAVALGLQSGNAIAQELASGVGIRDFSMGASAGENGQEAQMSGYIGPNLYLKYGYSLFEKIGAITARYNLTEALFLELYSGRRKSVDLFWRINRNRKGNK